MPVKLKRWGEEISAILEKRPSGLEFHTRGDQAAREPN